MIPEEVVISKIFLIRGKKVMLDGDLAELYEVETKRLNEQVKRNISRFPEDFMFQLLKEEFENLKSQFATSRWGGSRKLPHAFTEHGVLMSSNVLNSERAINGKNGEIDHVSLERSNHAILLKNRCLSWSMCFDLWWSE